MRLDSATLLLGVFAALAFVASAGLVTAALSIDPVASGGQLAAQMRAVQTDEVIGAGFTAVIGTVFTVGAVLKSAFQR